MDNTSFFLSAGLPGAGSGNKGSALASISSTAPSVVGTDANTGNGGSGIKGADFADLFAQIMVSSNRQSLAAGTSIGSGTADPSLSDSQQTLAAPSLTTIPLGPQLQLVTAASPLMDGSSLLAFARSQGLDESTVSSLFSEMAQKISATGLSDQTAGASSTTQIPSNTASSDPANALVLASLASWSPLTTAAMGLASNTQTQAGGDLMQIPSGMAQVLQELKAEMHWQVDNSGATTAAAATSTNPVSSNLAADSTQSPGALLTSNGESVLGASGTSTNSLTGLSAASDLVNSTATGMLDTLRLRLQPVEAVTQRLAAMASQGESGSWGGMTGFTQGDGAVIDLGLLAQGQAEGLGGKGVNGGHATSFNDTLSALASLGNTTTESGAAVSGLSAAQSVNNTGNPESTGSTPGFAEQLANSQQNYQQMSDKLGQALAARLQDQLQTGQWKMQMNVEPAHLGKISIDLNMHSGGLDATFKSDNVATRDLIVAGMPTLKNNLNQTGTTVASVWVNSDARGQSGGNSTPGQGRQTPPEPKGNPENTEAESQATAVSTGEAGWYLMA